MIQATKSSRVPSGTLFSIKWGPPIVSIDLTLSWCGATLGFLCRWATPSPSTSPIAKSIRVHLWRLFHSISFVLQCSLYLFCYSWCIFICKVFVQFKLPLPPHPLACSTWASPFGRLMYIFVVRVKNRWGRSKNLCTKCVLHNEGSKIRFINNQSPWKVPVRTVNRVFSGLADYYYNRLSSATGSPCTVFMITLTELSYLSICVEWFLYGKISVLTCTLLNNSNYSPV